MEKKIKTLLTALIALTFTVALSSCGNKQETAVKEQISLMNDYADEFAKDPKSAELAKIETKILDVAKRMQSFDQLSVDDTKKLTEKYGTEMSEAVLRYQTAQASSMMGNMGKMLEGFNLDGLTK